jgi:hypothetical protein
MVVWIASFFQYLVLLAVVVRVDVVWVTLCGISILNSEILLDILVKSLIHSSTFFKLWFWNECFAVKM